MNPGTLVISLDFELFWGVRDKFRLDQYRRHLLGVREVIPALLALFREYDIAVTWATVGMLLFDRRTDLLNHLPSLRPKYRHPHLDPYATVDAIGPDEKTDPFHYGLSLVRQIVETPRQEFASHTFSHYYCLEDGQSLPEWEADLEAFRRAAARLGLTAQSLVLPRNQVSSDHLVSAAQAGFRCYRGEVMRSRLYAPRNEDQETRLRRLLRAADGIFNLSGHNVYTPPPVVEGHPVNLPASRFLRPVSSATRFLVGFERQRLCADLDAAAREGGVYHLWWHPHNFGADPAGNIALLRDVIRHFVKHREAGRMRSATMGELADEVRS
jgi:hypothetical protein